MSIKFNKASNSLLLLKYVSQESPNDEDSKSEFSTSKFSFMNNTQFTLTEKSFENSSINRIYELEEEENIDSNDEPFENLDDEENANSVDDGTCSKSSDDNDDFDENINSSSNKIRSVSELVNNSETLLNKPEGISIIDSNNL